MKLALVEIIKIFPKQQVLFNSTIFLRLKKSNFFIFICCRESSFSVRKIATAGIERWHL